MKKIILFVLLLVIQVSAQQEFSLTKTYCDNFMHFTNSDSSLVLVTIRIFCDKNRDSCYFNQYIIIYSSKDGKIKKEFALFDKYKVIYSLSLSHDDSDLVVALADRGDRGPIQIKKYSLHENRWLWEKEFYDIKDPLQLTFSKDNKNIICVSPQNTMIMDAKTGFVIRKSNKIAEIGADPKWLKYALSSDGKYFAFWWGKYLSWSIVDEGPKRMLDLPWYGIRWLFTLGMMKNHFYIWDVENDTLLNDITIPYQTVRGSPVFTNDGKELVIDIDCELKAYSLADRTWSDRSIEIPSCRLNIGKEGWRGDYKIISPDNLYLAAISDNWVGWVFNRKSSELLLKFERRDDTFYGLETPFPIAFSSDSKYFAFIARGNKLCLYNTETWSKIWESELSVRKEK